MSVPNRDNNADWLRTITVHAVGRKGIAAAQKARWESGGHNAENTIKPSLSLFWGVRRCLAL